MVSLSTFTFLLDCSSSSLLLLPSSSFTFLLPVFGFGVLRDFLVSFVLELLSVISDIASGLFIFLDGEGDVAERNVRDDGDVIVVGVSIDRSDASEEESSKTFTRNDIKVVRNEDDGVKFE